MDGVWGWWIEFGVDGWSLGLVYGVWGWCMEFGVGVWSLGLVDGV